MTTDNKPSFSIHESGDYIKVIDEDGRVITASAHVSHKDKYTLICAALNHYYDNSPEKVEDMKKAVVEVHNNFNQVVEQNAALAEALEKIADISEEREVMDIAITALQANKFTNDKTE